MACTRKKGKGANPEEFEERWGQDPLQVRLIEGPLFLLKGSESSTHAPRKEDQEWETEAEEDNDNNTQTEHLEIGGIWRYSGTVYEPLIYMDRDLCFSAYKTN